MKIKRWVLIMAAAIMLLVPSCKAANHPPIITSLKSGLEVIPPSGSCQIRCDASDEDGDSLNFLWSADGGDISAEGSVITWTAPDISGTYTITVKATDGNGGQDTSSISIIVNRPPTITSLTATASGDWIAPLGGCPVECVASDPESDELSYEWSASGGKISGTDSVVRWTAPEAVGIYIIRVKVIDDKGGENTASLNINVAIDNPPIIEDLVVTAEHKYLKKESGEYLIGKEKSCQIKCLASTPRDGELNYKWSASGGELSGEGSMITWTAPNTSGKVTVTVTVSDTTGNIVSRGIVFNVVICSTCTFR